MDRGFHGIERYDPDTNMMLIGGYGGVDWNADTTVSKRLFAPRFGLAYRLGTGGVIRAGYGITYDPYNLGRPMRSPYPAVIQFSANGPTILHAVWSDPERHPRDRHRRTSPRERSRYRAKSAHAPWPRDSSRGATCSRGT